MDNLHIGAGGGAGQALVAARGLTPAKVDDWIAEAQPGARLCYYHGWSFAADGDERLGAVLYDRAEKGFLFLYQGRKDVDGTRPYIAERSSRPVVDDAPRRRPLTLHEQAREFSARGGR